jgi:hypothetical protein
LVDAWEAEEAGVICWLVAKAIARSTSLCSYMVWFWMEGALFLYRDRGKGEDGGVNGRELTRRKAVAYSCVYPAQAQLQGCRMTIENSRGARGLPLSWNVMLQPRSKSYLFLTWHVLHSIWMVLVRIILCCCVGSTLRSVASGHFFFWTNRTQVNWYPIFPKTNRYRRELRQFYLSPMARIYYYVRSSKDAII